MIDYILFGAYFMKILHICTSGEYTDGHTYQENLLTKYMAKLGLDVFVIASPKAYDGFGNSIELEVPVDYIYLPYRR